MQNLYVSTALAKEIAVALADQDDNTLVADMIEGETDFFECIDALLEANAQDDALATGAKAVIERITTRMNAAEERIGKRRALIADAMNETGQKSIKRPLGTLTMKALSAKVIVTDESALPPVYVSVKTTRTPDKRAIKEALESGKSVPGAQLDNGGQSLQIRA